MPTEPDPEGAVGPAEFPETRWSLVRAAGPGGSEEALARLAELTWRPACAYLQALGHGADEARDLTQAFFLGLLEGEFLSRADPERGSFRGFLKRSLKHFALDDARRRRATKRGGDRRFVPLTEEHGDLGPLALVDAGGDPEAALDAVWRQSFLDDALARLERELGQAGRTLEWGLFRARYLEGEAPDRRALGRRFGVSEVDVKNRLARTRARLKGHLREALIETVGRDEELAGELAWLLEGGPS